MELIVEKISSFCINHDVLEKGIYLSRVDGDIVTYDIRMRLPNREEVLKNSSLHTIEHLFATIVRNGKYKDHIIYFGPMGCRTGCYFIVKDLNHKLCIDIIIDTFKKIASFEGEIPGNTSKECGNYLDHDLSGAKEEAAKMIHVIENWNESMLIPK
jgi:S-ribosylhomocysteine lyase